MITFARGLVLRSGERQLEFERDLGDGRVQFKYLDNFEVCTFRLSKLYQDILDKRYVPTTVPNSENAPYQPEALALPSSLLQDQIDLIDFRMHFVRAVEKDSKATSKSRARKAVVCQKVWDAMPAETRLFKQPTASAVEVWIRKYRQADANPFVLLDRRSLVIRPLRLEKSIESLIEHALNKHYLQLNGASARRVHWLISRQVEQLNERQGLCLEQPSQRTVDRRIQSIPPYILDLKRIGTDYARNKWRYSLSGDVSTRILERVEVDHTLLDIWVLDPRTGLPLGRPWITLVIDRFSKYLLGLYISFYGPSVATTASAIKESIRPKDNYMDMLKSPQLIWSAMGCAECYVVDNGLEFHAQQFQRIAWELRSDLIFNPVRSPWYKALIERYIQESNRVLPLHGKVHHPLANAMRQDPAKSAAIVFNDLCLCLLEWASQVNPLQIHAKTLVRSLDLWEEGRSYVPPPSLPTNLRGLDLMCGLGAQRTVDGDGVFFKYLRFNSPELQDYSRNNARSFRTEIRFNPEDLRQIYVQLPKAKSWLSVPLQRPMFAPEQPVSLMQLQIIRDEAGRKLTKANAPEMLGKALVQLSDRWQEATRRGLRLRRDMSLTRLQGLTSVPLVPALAPPTAATTAQPLELSPAMYKALPEVIPFRAFSLDED